MGWARLTVSEGSFPESSTWSKSGPKGRKSTNRMALVCWIGADPSSNSPSTCTRRTPTLLENIIITVYGLWSLLSAQRSVVASSFTINFTYFRQNSNWFLYYTVHNNRHAHWTNNTLLSLGIHNLAWTKSNRDHQHTQTELENQEWQWIECTVSPWGHWNWYEAIRHCARLHQAQCCGGSYVVHIYWVCKNCMTMCAWRFKLLCVRDQCMLLWDTVCQHGIPTSLKGLAS